MSIETRSDSPVSVDRFARVFVKGPEELPSGADTYHDPDQGYYFKLHLDGVTADEASPMISKARERFDVELVRRVTKDGLYKERVYVDSASEVPDDKKVQQGPSGGIYYETGVQSVGISDESQSRNVAVIHWDDIELGDDIVYQLPSGEELFAEVTYIEEREQGEDIIHVDADGETQRAIPGTYTVDRGEEKSISTSVRMVKAGDWVRYQGPRGGDGWRHVQSGDVIYQDEPPGNAEGSDSPYGDDFDPREEPEGGYALGWEGPPDSRDDLVSGQAVEWFEDGNFQYGDVESVDGGSVRVDPDKDDERSIDFSQITAQEQVDGEVEIHFDEADPEDFVENVNTFIEQNPEMGAFLTEHSAEEMEDHTLISTADGSAGAAVSPEGDIQNVYALDDAPDHAGELAFAEAIEEGGRTLDCYDTILPTLYSNHGFVETGRMEFNPEFAPEGWNEEKFGHPDVVFMAYDPEESSNVGHEITDTYYDGTEWEDAKRGSRERAVEKSRGGTTTGRGSRGSRRGVRRGKRRVDSGGCEADESDLKAEGSLTSGSDGSSSARYSPEDEEEEEEIGVGTPPVAEKDCDGHHFGPYMENPSLRLEEGEAYCEEEDETFRTDEGDDVITVCPVCDEGLGDSGEVPGPDGETGHLGKAPPIYEFEKDAQWVSFMGPEGGEGWVNLATGEKRYQKQRPGPGPGGEEEIEFADGWEEPVDISDLEEGQMVEVQDGDEFIEGEYVGEMAGYPTVETQDGKELHPGQDGSELTAVESDFSRHDPFFDDEDRTPEEYWGAVQDEIPSDTDAEFEPFEVGQDVALDLPGEDDPVSIPIYGFVDGEADFPASSDSLVFHYDDLEAAVGTETMHDRWGEPGETSPTITGPATSVGDVVLGPADEHIEEDESPEGSEDEQYWDGAELGEDEWLAEQGIDLDTEFYYDIGGEPYPARVSGATSMTTDDSLSHAVLEVDVPHKDEPHTAPVHPNVVPDTIPDGPLEGQVEPAMDDTPTDEFDSVDADISDVPEGSEVILESNGYFTTAEVYQANVGYDPGDGSTVHPHEADIAAVHEDAVDALSEPEESEEGGTTPSEDEAEGAVAQPASEDTESDSYPLDEYTPEDAEEFRDMSDIGANHGNSVSAMEVAVMPDGSKMVHKDTSHHTVTNDDIERELAGYHAGKHFDENIPVHTADLDEGWAASEVAPGVDAKDATPEMKDEVSFDDFVDMAATQIIIGNTDLHQNNVRVDEEGNLYAFDLDRSGGDIQGDWVGNLDHYEDTLDRMLGELEKSAKALDIEVGTPLKAEIIHEAEEKANSLVLDDQAHIWEDVANYSEEFADTIDKNIEYLRNGEVSL